VKLGLNKLPFFQFLRVRRDIKDDVEAVTSHRDNHKGNEDVPTVGQNRTSIGVLLGTGVLLRNSVQVLPPKLAKVDTDANDVGDDSRLEEHLSPGEKEHYSQTRVCSFIAVATLEPPLQR